MKQKQMNLRNNIQEDKKNIFIISGRSACGKDSIFTDIKSLLQINNIDIRDSVLYTSRPMRPGEIDKVTYNFVTDDKFAEMIANNNFLEYRYYDTIQGRWYYGTTSDSFDPNHNYIINGGFKLFSSLKEELSDIFNIYLIYINVDKDKLLKRSIDREMKSKEPDLLEVCRRFTEQEKGEYSEENIKKYSKYINITVNNNSEREYSLSVQKILSFIKIHL